MMKRSWGVGLLLIAGLCIATCRAQEKAAPREASGAPLWELTPAELDARLAGWQQAYPRLEERLRAILLERLGTPVRLGCLGEAAPPDEDPVFRLDEADCTVLVLTTAAMAHASTLAEAQRNMGFANYRDVHGERPITYEDRLHFTEDRLDASPYFRDATARLLPDSLLRTIRLTLNEKKDGDHLLEIPWTRELTLRYLPSERVSASLLHSLPPLVGVALVKRSHLDIGLAVAHEGVLLDGESLVHASSEAKEVVRVPFLDYLRKGEGFRFDGLILYEFL